jgi:ABC-type uncharacterized transport system involved in gliding motility auxiliary subunit
LKNLNFLLQVRTYNQSILIGGLVSVLAGIFGMLIFNSATWWSLVLVGLGVVALALFLTANLADVKEVGKKRSTQVRANLTLVAAAVVAIVIAVNYIASRHPVRFDLTANQAYTLSSQTLDILKGLPQEVDVTMLISGKRATAEVQKAQSLLEEYEKYSPKFHFKVVDVDKDPGEAKRLDIHEYNTVVFESGDNRKDVLQRDYLTYAFNGQQPAPKFQGEAAFTSALLKMSDTTHPVFYFTQGHGEKDRNNPQGDGFNTFADMLGKENYEVKDLNLLTSGKIPDDASVIAIVGPERSFQPSEVQLLQEYVQKGGKIVAFIDPIVRSGLDPLLKDFGIKLGNDVVIDPTSFAYPNLMDVVPQYNYHEIVSKLSDQHLATVMPFSRSVQKVDPSLKGVTQTILLQTTDKGFGKTNLKDKSPKYRPGIDTKGPIPLGIACEWPLTDKPDTMSRIVVYGSSTVICNQMVQAPGNIDLGLNSFSWAVGEQNKISIHPKEDETQVLNLSNVSAAFIKYLTIVILPGIVLAVGVFIWYRRRSL